MKEIYFVLTHTGTVLSRIIKIYTRKKYSHVSIAINDKMDKMYSFGRLNAYNPFIGGFVEESTKKGTFKRFNKSDTIVLSIEVTEEQYENLRKNIESFLSERDKYKFNIIGMFMAGFNHKYKRENYFYCAEFVKYVIEDSSININLPDIIKPDDFRNLENTKVIYQGKLCDIMCP